VRRGVWKRRILHDFRRADCRVDVDATALHASVSHSPSGPEVRSLRAHFSPRRLFSALDASQQASGATMRVRTHCAVSLDIDSIFPVEIAHVAVIIVEHVSSTYKGFEVTTNGGCSLCRTDGTSAPSRSRLAVISLSSSCHFGPAP
jgi:hypothetical protein